MRRVFAGILVVLLLAALGCANKAGTVLADGTYEIDVTLNGGSGKASIASPAELTIQNGNMTLKVVWSSDKYDYMLVGGEKLLPEIVDGHSVFTVPVQTLETPLNIVADTTAMSTPHEIEYTITFDVSSLKSAS